MLNIILKDVKNMLRRPISFLILFFGLIAASASAILYFSYSSITLNIKNTVYNQDRTIEVKGYVGADEFYKIEEMITEGKLPEAEYVTAISYNSRNYDVIGYKGYSAAFFTAAKGEYIESGDEGKGLCIVSANWFEDEIVEVGQELKIQGKDYTVKGISNGIYDPTLYDIRRLEHGTEYISGEDTSLERDESLLNRPDKYAVIPMEDFCSMGLDAAIYHITFTEPISNEQRTEIEQLFADELGLAEFTAISQFYEVSSITQWSDFAIYFIAVIAGLINIISLFAYFIKNNRRQYEVYRLMGASNGEIHIIILAELFIFTALGYIISLAGAIPIINSLDIFEKASVPSILSLLAIFLLIYLAAILMFSKQIRSITISKYRKQKKQKKKTIRTDGSAGNRFIYLLSFHYNKKSALNITSLICLAIAAAFTLTFALAYVFEAGKFVRFAENNYNTDLGLISFSDYILEEDMNSYWNGETSSLMQHSMITDILEKIRNMEGVEKVEITETEFMTVWDEEYKGATYLYAYPYTDDYIKTVDLPLAEGNWQDMYDFDKNDESAVIPCVIFPEVATKYPLGCEFRATIDFISGEIMIDRDTYEAKVITEPLEKKFKVVGILASDTYLSSNPTGFYGATSDSIDITYFLESVAYRTNERGMGNSIIIPQLYHNGKPENSHSGNSYYVYLEKNATEEQKQAIQAAVEPDAQIHFYSNALANYDVSYSQAGGDTYVMHSIIAAVLLILGMGGFSIIQFSMNRRTYGVYYACGMPWSRSIGMILTTNAINAVLPSILGAYMGITVATALRGQFTTYSIVCSMLCGVGLVLAIYLITAAAIAIYMKNKRPKNLLTEEAK